MDEKILREIASETGIKLGLVAVMGEHDGVDVVLGSKDGKADFEDIMMILACTAIRFAKRAVMADKDDEPDSRAIIKVNAPDGVKDTLENREMLVASFMRSTYNAVIENYGKIVKTEGGQFAAQALLAELDNDDENDEDDEEEDVGTHWLDEEGEDHGNTEAETSDEG